MRRYDANPGLSAFTVVIGAVLGVVLAVVLDFGATGTIVLVLMGVALAGLVASASGLVGERDRGERKEHDLPSHYDDY
jgi:VIT1/CCC1 family predicted Fe2+/Mn2+ transporter